MSFLLQRISLFSVLLWASLLIACSGYFAKAAYDISHHHGFDPSTSLKDRSSHTNMITYQDKSILEKSKLLFERVPVMKLLFWEVIVSQSLSSLISFSFMVSVQNTILDNNERAGFTGNVRFLNANSVAVSLNAQSHLKPCFIVLCLDQWYKWHSPVFLSALDFEIYSYENYLVVHALLYASFDSVSNISFSPRSLPVEYISSISTITYDNFFYHEDTRILCSKYDVRKGKRLCLMNHSCLSHGHSLIDCTPGKKDLCRLGL